MITAGMDVARFNFSHGDEETHRRAVQLVREAAAATGRQVALMQDIQGPKIRTRRLAHPLVRLVRGNQVTLTARDVVGDETVVGVDQPVVLKELRPRDRVLLVDGQIELRVSGCDLGFDYTALSFVRSAADVRRCREAMADVGVENPIIAKLERAQALARLPEIIDEVDAVMVARGDLGTELSLGEVPAAQKDIIQRANARGVPVITATEMLESMVTSNRPTRAEASDVANAIWDGTDAVMLSQETSIGAHPAEAVRAMARICLAAERHPAYQRQQRGWLDGSVPSAMAHAAAGIADEVGARAIIAFTETGSTALHVSKTRPRVPVIAASPHLSVLRRTTLYSGVVPLQVERAPDTDAMIAGATGAAKRGGLVKEHDRVVVVAGVPPGRAGQTNLVKVESV
jgi:pyruvate kinase